MMAVDRTSQLRRSLVTVRSELAWLSRVIVGLVAISFSAMGCDRESAPPSPDVPSDSALFALSFALGEDDGDTLATFGQVAALGGTVGGDILVLDQRPAALRWFSSTGDHVASVAQRGQGPGELAEPRAMHVSDDLIYVIDPPNGRVSKFRMAGDELRFDGEFRVNTPDPTSLCRLGHQLFLMGAMGDAPIQILDDNGAVEGVIGELTPESEDMFGPATTMVTAQRNRGHLLCVEDLDLVISMSIYTPRITAYTVDGYVVWEQESSGLVPLGFDPAPRGGVLFRVPEGGYHMGETLVRWGPESILVQYTLRGSDMPTVETRELSLSSGEELRRIDGLPLIHAFAGEQALAYESEPIPRILLGNVQR